MRMYTLHFGFGLEHTGAIDSQIKGNFPYAYTGWNNSTGSIPNTTTDNAQIVSHDEIYSRYGVLGGHGKYCLETWSHDEPTNACRLYTGGFGDTLATPLDVRAFYLKFDFMYTNTPGGSVVVVQRTKTGLGDEDSEDLTISLVNGYLEVIGSWHVQQPETGYLPTAWMPNSDNRLGNIYLAPNKWHEIQIFVHACQGWDISEIGTSLVPKFVDSFVPFFEAYESNPGTCPSIRDAESENYNRPLQMDQWPANGHPKFPNTMLPGNDQSIWPPVNFGSGQYFYGANLGMVYVWVNGELDIQHTTNIVNEQSTFTSQQSVFLGYSVVDSDPDDASTGRFFYNNIIMNDIREPSGSYPSKIFDPVFSNDPSLVWDPRYKLQFTAMQMDPNFWEAETDRKHDTWFPQYPLGALVPSGDPYFVEAPPRYGAPTDSMIPHGTKLTVVHIDWNGESQDYTTATGNRTIYPDYDVDYAYQCLQPNESNPFSVNQDDPRISSTVAGNQSLFYLKRPPAISGKQPLAGGYGLGGIKDYLPNGSPLQPIYRIWTCIQDHTIGSVEPIDCQYHIIRVPSGITYADYVSDNQCPGDKNFRAYHNGSATIANGFSMCDWPYNPVTGLPWTWADLDEIQIGVSHGTHSSGDTATCYTIFLVVEHGSNKDVSSGELGENLLSWSVADDLPFYMGTKKMYYGERDINIWNVSPSPTIRRTHTKTQDGQAIISGARYSGTIDFEYKIRYINGEVIPGDEYRKFDEYFPVVWVYTIDSIEPETPIRYPMRNEIIEDCDGNYYTFLGYPVLQWNTKKFPTDGNLSPLDRYPYVVYDYTTLYVIPLHLYNQSTHSSVEGMQAAALSNIIKPSVSGVNGTTWIINAPQRVFDFELDPDSCFHPFSPSSVMNYAVTHPDDTLDYSFPESYDDHDYYFQAPNLPSGSVWQDIDLIDAGISTSAIDSGLINAYIGLYQTTTEKTINDTGEGKFEFYSDVLLSGYTFGPDGTAGWHLNSTTVRVPSGTRSIRFTFTALRNTESDISPGGNLGGTSNMACFDGAFCVLGSSDGNDIHPADIDSNNIISSEELANYIISWQNGTLPSGISKAYLTKAEEIWLRHNASGYISDGIHEAPQNWLGSDDN